MTMIERAARALAKLESANWDAAHFGETPSGQDPEEMRAGYFEQARAVLQAIREPSEGMVAAGDDAITYHPEDIIRNQAEPCWTAMIDAALSE